MTPLLASWLAVVTSPACGFPAIFTIFDLPTEVLVFVEEEYLGGDFRMERWVGTFTDREALCACLRDALFVIAADVDAVRRNPRSVGSLRVRIRNPKTQLRAFGLMRVTLAA